MLSQPSAQEHHTGVHRSECCVFLGSVTCALKRLYPVVRKELSGETEEEQVFVMSSSMRSL